MGNEDVVLFLSARLIFSELTESALFFLKFKFCVKTDDVITVCKFIKPSV